MYLLELYIAKQIYTIQWTISVSKEHNNVTSEPKVSSHPEKQAILANSVNSFKFNLYSPTFKFNLILAVVKGIEACGAASTRLVGSVKRNGRRGEPLGEDGGETDPEA